VRRDFRSVTHCIAIPMQACTETAIGGRYTTRRGVLMPGAEYSATRVSLTALTERVHSDAGIPPGGKCFLLMNQRLLLELVRSLISNLRFSVSGFTFIVAFSYVTVDCKILTSVHHSPFSMYWLPQWWKQIGTHAIPHPEHERQQSDTDFGSCIFGNMSGAWSHTSTNKDMAAIMGIYLQNIPGLFSRTVTTHFINRATTKFLWAF
jgi:hypothetical protein